MKITGIDIGEYRQFKNIKFDFTYPASHAKAGQPLDKVCFIGQSGTGKSTLLNVIWKLFVTLEQVLRDNANNSDTAIISGSYSPELSFDLRFSVDIKGELMVFGKAEETEENYINFLDDWDLTELSKKKQSNLISLNKLCIFLKDSIAREADAFLADQREQLQSFSDFVKTTSQIEEDKATFQNRVDAAGSRKVVSLGEMTSLSTWQYLLKNIINYDNETPKFIVNLGTKAKGETKEAFKELESWLAKNPRIEFQEKCLKPLLDKLFLEVDLVGEDGAYLALRTKGGAKFPNNTLSTGTRQLLATAIPIYKFDTTDTVILFDEPERSLFPDIQRELISYYISLAPEAQFFFATHSPIIASAFEPCERFILYFDENGEVKFRNGTAPEGDDPNDILRQDFNMSPLMLEKGLEEYQRYLDLTTKIKHESDVQRRMELIAERSVLGNKYSFPVTSPDETN